MKNETRRNPAVAIATIAQLNLSILLLLQQVIFLNFIWLNAQFREFGFITLLRLLSGSLKLLFRYVGMMMRSRD